MTASLIHYLTAHGLTAFLPLGIGIFVASQRPRLFLFRIFLAYNVTISWWAIFTLCMVFAPDPTLALFWDRISLIGIAFIPSTFLHFTLSFLRKNKPYQSLLQICYLLSGLFGLLAFTPLMVASVSRKHFVPYFTDPGPVYPIFLFFFAVTMGMALFFSYRSYLQRRGTSQVRPTFYFFLAALVAVLGGGGNFFVPYDIFPPLLVPYGSYGVVGYAIVTAYLIVIHRLLGMAVIVKKTLVFTGLFGMVMAVVGGMTALSQTFIGHHLGLSTAASTVLSVFAAILLYEPTNALLVRLTDRFLFQKKESVRSILRRLSERIITILDLNQVAKTILDTVEESLRSETGVLFLRKDSVFTKLRSYGIPVQEGVGDFQAVDPLARHLGKSRRLINLEDELTSSRVPVEVSLQLNQLKAVLAIPLFLQGELIGVLTLGKKKSDQEYTAEEIDYFPTVAGQVAIALSNARLYGESIEARKKIEEMQIELIHREKMAFVADLVKGIAHEVFNPLTPVFHAIDDLENGVFVELFDLYKKNEKSLPPEDQGRYLKALDSLRQLTERLKVNTDHIHLVIDTLNRMQKDDKETIGPIDLKTFLKDSRAMIGMELHGDAHEIPVTEDITRQIPPVKANPTLLKQVFVNLFKNSIHAMEGRDDKKIEITAQVDPKAPGLVTIDFTDQGAGIAPDILPKVFDFGFTTKGAKGQGIGLNQCKLIIEKFGG